MSFSLGMFILGKLDEIGFLRYKCWSIGSMAVVNSEALSYYFYFYF